MKISKILMTFIIAIIIVEANGQTNFLPGYYVTPEKDTVRGFIEYRSEKKNSQYFSFKAAPDGKITKLYPSTALAYCIDDKQWYESHEITTKKTQGDIDGFFKVLISGRLSLLSYSSRFFAKDGDRMFEISKSNEIVDGKVKIDYKGLGLLKSFISECPVVASFDMKKNFTQSDYEQIVTGYNNCMGGPSRIHQRIKIKIKPAFAAGILAAPVLTAIKLSQPSFNTTIPGDLHFKLGVYGSAFIPRASENLRLVLEVSGGAVNNYKFFNSYNADVDLFVKYDYLNFPLYFRFGKKIFIDLGMNNQIIVSQHQQLRIATISQNMVTTSDGQIDKLRAWSSGLVAGVGIKRMLFEHPVRLSLRYCNYNSAARYKNLVSGSTYNYRQNYQSLELNMSYQLFGK